MVGPSAGRGRGRGRDCHDAIDTAAAAASAAASMHRRGKPKVRTGCLCCKKRHVKCDEGKPSCQRCKTFGIDCDGYLPYRTPSGKVAPRVNASGRFRAILPSHASSTSGGSSASASVSSTSSSGSSSSSSDPSSRASFSSVSPSDTPPSGSTSPPPSPSPSDLPVAAYARQLTPICASPKTKIAWTETEYRYFTLYRTQTALSLSGFFDSPFWSRAVLQESQTNAGIRNAIIALGALSLTLSDISTPASAALRKRHGRFGLDQYQLALQCLQRELATGKVPLRTVLMACLFCVCIETFIGDHEASMRQVRAGIRLLESRSRLSRVAQPGGMRDGAVADPAGEDNFEEEIREMFARVDVQSRSHLRWSEEPLKIAPQNLGVGVRCGQPAFETLQDARRVMDVLVHQSAKFHQAGLKWRFEDPATIPSELKEEQEALLLGLKKWWNEFEPLYRLLTTTTTTTRGTGTKPLGHEEKGATLLSIHHIMATTLSSCALAPDEMAWDQHLPTYRTIVTKSRLLLEDGSSPDPTTTNNNNIPSIPGTAKLPPQPQRAKQFAFDLGVLMALHVVGAKCREHRTRWAAISLLKTYPRRESVWDSERLMKVCRWIANIEEEHGHGHQDDDELGGEILGDGNLIPEERRVAIMKTTYDSAVREATCIAGRRKVGMAEWENVRELVIKW